jgi:hypothetical protein
LCSTYLCLALTTIFTTIATATKKRTVENKNSIWDSINSGSFASPVKFELEIVVVLITVVVGAEVLEFAKRVAGVVVDTFFDADIVVGSGSRRPLAILKC